MSCWLLGLLLSAAPAGSGSPSQPPVRAARSDREFRQELQGWLRRERSAPTAAERADAIEHLAALYREASRDPNLARRPSLRGYRTMLGERLAAIHRELTQSLARRSRSDSPGASRRRRGDSRAADAGSPGQPGEAASGGGRGGALAADYGPALVALIERTISPDFWEGQGGRGTIIYYRPGRALVVHATPEIHERVGRLLRALRDAGR